MHPNQIPNNCFNFRSPITHLDDLTKKPRKKRANEHYLYQNRTRLPAIAGQALNLQCYIYLV
jgi:hypothetical protein